MRYWGYLCAKVVVASAVLYGLPVWLSKGSPAAPHRIAFAPTLPTIAAMMGWFLLAAGTIYLIVWDQRHRCRTCLRRLRMPVATGSWDSCCNSGGRGSNTSALTARHAEGRRAADLRPCQPGVDGSLGRYWEELSASSEQSGKK